MVSKRWGTMDFARTARSGRFTYHSAVAPFNMSHSPALLPLHSRFQFRDSTLGTLFFVFLGAMYVVAQLLCVSSTTYISISCGTQWGHG